MDGKQTAVPSKSKKRSAVGNGADSLVRAKKFLDRAIPHLSGFPEFQKEAKDLREKVFNRFVDEERQSLT